MTTTDRRWLGAMLVALVLTTGCSPEREEEEAPAAPDPNQPCKDRLLGSWTGSGLEAEYDDLGTLTLQYRGSTHVLVTVMTTCSTHRAVVASSQYTVRVAFEAEDRIEVSYGSYAPLTLRRAAP